MLFSRLTLIFFLYSLSYAFSFPRFIFLLVSSLNFHHFSFHVNFVFYLQHSLSCVVFFLFPFTVPDISSSYVFLFFCQRLFLLSVFVHWKLVLFVYTFRLLRLILIYLTFHLPLFTSIIIFPFINLNWHRQYWIKQVL